MIINQSSKLGEEAKEERKMMRERQKRIKLGPMEGEIAEDYPEVAVDRSRQLELQLRRENVFKKERPKSAFHSKFARPSSGVHGVYAKKALESRDGSVANYDASFLEGLDE